MIKTKLLINHFVLQQLGGAKKKWNTLEHNGVLFPPEYEQHFIPVVYNSEKIVLDKDAEEAATLYAKFIETDYVKNKIFNKNFWHDWKKILGKDHIIDSLDGCDFKLIHDDLIAKKEEKKLDPVDESKKKKKKNINMQSLMVSNNLLVILELNR